MLNTANNAFSDIFKNIIGVKALYMDEETIKIMALSITRTEILGYEIIDSGIINELSQKPICKLSKSLNSIFYIRPTEANVIGLREELENPHFGKYYIYFSNLIPQSIIHDLASSDKFCLVEQVEEVYFDYYPLNNRLFSLNIHDVYNLRIGVPDVTKSSRIADGIFGVLSTFHLRPCIRYESNSSLCSFISHQVLERINHSSQNFENQNAESLLVILDRRSDPITPLIYSWYYASTIHELFGLENNVVTLPEDSKSYVFDERTDSFVSAHMNSFLSDVGPAVAQQMNEAIALNEASKQKITNPEQIPEIINAATQFQQKMAISRAHVSIVESINNRVQKDHLLIASELEQSLASTDDANSHLSEINRLISDKCIPRDIIVRIIILFCLRYENRSQEHIFQAKLLLTEDEKPLIEAAFQYCGKNVRSPEDIFKNISTFTRIFTDIIPIYDAQQKVLDQHRCLLHSIVKRIRNNNLDPMCYPYRGSVQTTKPQKLIIFYVGGATYEEMRVSCQLSSSDMDIIVGGTSIHNPNSFMTYELKKFTK